MKILEYKLRTSKVEGKRILTISDLHVLSEKELPKLDRIISSLCTNNIKYDAIIINGDILDSTNVLRENREVTSRLLNFIQLLGSFAPIYIAYGSHDLAHYNQKMQYHTGQPWSPDEAMFKSDFLDKIAGYPGVNLLSNATDSLGDGYTISIYNPSLSYAMKNPDGNEELLYQESEKYNFLNSLNPNDVNILACHYPNAIISLYQKGLLNNVDLGIAGHNHSGITQFLPLEILLNILRMPNQGLITPGKSINPHDTRYSRGLVELDNQTKLLINPSITTFANCAGALNKLDFLFYEGASDVEFVPNEELTRTRRK